MKNQLRFSVGVLAVSVLLGGCSTVPQSPSQQTSTPQPERPPQPERLPHREAPAKWEYRIIRGYTEHALQGQPSLAPLLDAAGAEGWEAILWTQDGPNPPRFTVLLKRAKH